MPLGDSVLTGIDPNQPTIGNEEIKERIAERVGPLTSVERHREVGVGPASVFTFEGARGRVGFISAMTFVLISSSATMAGAVAAAGRGDRRSCVQLLVATLGGGLVFLGMQAWEWSHVIAEGATPWQNPWGAALFGAYFFLITGFHGTHVLTGAIVLAVTAIRLHAGGSSADGVEMAGLYWHFVDLVWVFIFTLFYLL